jgi:hypothetical protein
MAGATLGSAAKPVWAGRTLEWLILGAVILVFAVGLGRAAQRLQAQAEIGTVQATLGALRYSLLVDHLNKSLQIRAENVANPQTNPFKVLDRLPPNYVGEASMSAIAGVTPGSWVFDKDCVCVGYRPMYPQGLLPASDLAVLWFRVTETIGPLQLTPLRAYTWQGQVVQ